MRRVRAEAPGRVNLIGEHTDYHDGYVMPCAVPQRTHATVEVRGDLLVTVRSAQMPSEPFEYELGRERQTRGWGDYIQGLTWVLAREGFAIDGFDLELNSTVPLGSGLSSSAALEVATLRGLRDAFDLELPDVALALAAQRAEVEFVGAPVGVMDQMAASLADEREALFIDTRTLSFERIRLPASLELVVINSGVAHQHAGGDYVTRRRESEEAARQLGVDKLRDLGLEALPRIELLPPLLARRARHVVTENARVLEARAALIAADLTTFGQLLSASHASLRDDYEVSIEPVNLLVSLAEAQSGVFGARMTGGGFGGAIVVVTAAGTGRAVAAKVSAEYARRSGLTPQVLLPQC